MCEYCEKRIEMKVAKNPIWLTEYVEIPYEEDEVVQVYLDVDKKKINGKVKINYCPFCGKKL